MSCSFDSNSESTASAAAAPSRREAAGSGGGSNNIPPSIHTETGGEDWLEISLYVRHYDFENLQKQFDEAKQAAEESPDLCSYVVVGKRIASISCGTAGAGDPKNRIAYRWVLAVTAGIKLLLMQRAEPHRTMPNAIARITSFALLQHGLTESWNIVADALAALGILVERDKVSRVDPCVDLGGVGIQPFCSAYSDGRYITRARKSTKYDKELPSESYRTGRRPTGLRMGGDIVIRIYDKLEECRFQREKMWLLQTRRYGKEVQLATRVEFQVRRESLKRLGVDTLNDWIKRRGSIVHCLTHSWFRLTTTEVDGKNPKRTPILPLWIEVQDRFADWAGKDLVPLEPLPKQPVDIEQSMAQVIGQLNSILAKCRCSINGRESYLLEASRLLQAATAKRDMPEEVRLRALKLGVAGS